MEKMQQWLKWVMQKPTRCHYSVYAEGTGYCGEAFYNVDARHGLASLDIKLLPAARGMGIAEAALAFAIDKAFTAGGAERAYVDPHPDNRKAWALYEKLGFVRRPRPDWLDEGGSYLELAKDQWVRR